MPSIDPQKNREYVRRHYQRHREKYYERNRRIKDQKIAFIREAKNVPCMDCGVRYPFFVMDFDHRDGDEKLSAVARMANVGWAKVKAEILKCDVVCANCHRVRTQMRRSGGTAYTPVLETGSSQEVAGSSPASDTNLRA